MKITIKRKKEQSYLLVELKIPHDIDLLIIFAS